MTCHKSQIRDINIELRVLGLLLVKRINFRVCPDADTETKIQLCHYTFRKVYKSIGTSFAVISHSLFHAIAPSTQCTICMILQHNHTIGDFWAPELDLFPEIE